MTTATQTSEYTISLIEQGFGHYELKLGTRGLESLRTKGRELDLTPPESFDQVAHDGREVAYLRAGDGY